VADLQGRSRGPEFPQIPSLDFILFFHRNFKITKNINIQNEKFNGFAPPRKNSKVRYCPLQQEKIIHIVQNQHDIVVYETGRHANNRQ